MIETITQVLPRPRKNKYKGGFPLHFEKKLIRLLGMDEKETNKIFHPFGGYAEYGEKNDINLTIPALFHHDAHNLSFIPNNYYELVVLDPPYNNEQADKLYKTPKLNYKKYIL